MSIGSFRLSQPVVAITEDTAGVRTHPTSVGLVGMEVLGRFSVTFDYAGNRMYLTPTSRVAEPFVYDASGIGLRTSGPSFSAVVVSRVRDASPGAAVDVRVGDAVVQIDGRHTSRMSLESIRAILQRPGEAHTLLISRQGKMVECVIKTRDLLN